MAPLFRDLFWEFSGYKIEQPGRQSVHWKLLRVTSNVLIF